MQVIIFNSGLGNRMGSLTKGTHKSMVQLEGYNETIFERQIRLLAEEGISDFVITVGPFKEQLQAVLDRPQYQNLKVVFVENPLYATTNYIYSFHLARTFVQDDILTLHGDLVFSRSFLKKVLAADENTSHAAVNRIAPLPDKDFKGRIIDGLVKEVGVNIFDEDCFAFQPFYRLRLEDVNAWLAEIAHFVEREEVGVYAENALNKITDRVLIRELSYVEDFVDEVDTLEDLHIVSRRIRQFD
jgi:phosphoenolpyruvate phosphomutase